MIRTGHERLAVAQLQPNCSLGRRPMREHGSRGALTPSGDRAGADNDVADPNVGEDLDAPVAHEDRCVTRLAVRARMRTAPVRVDRVAEAVGRSGADVVDDALGPHVEELHAAELAATGFTLEDRLVEERLLRSGRIGQLPPEL